MLIAKREQQGWTSRRRAARELHRIWVSKLPGAPTLEALEKTLYRHETGRVQVRDETYRSLYCLAYQASPQELFGDVAPDFDAAGGIVVRSHKFIPAYVGVKAVRQIIADRAMRDADLCLVDCHVGPAPSASGTCQLYAWPFGIAMFHLVEELVLPNLAALAVWRLRSYAENLDWATEQFRRLSHDSTPFASYVLSLYWALTSPWRGDQLDTALRILSMPKVLLERSADVQDALGHAELVERSLLDDGFNHAEIVSFGVKGISVGYASWSGVVYHPVAEHRALAEEHLVACELATQALWAYCGYINNEVEEGRDPVVSSEYGWRFLRAMRSRLVNARPQEDGQHRSMRTAILETSGVIGQMAHAIETLREIDGG